MRINSFSFILLVLIVMASDSFQIQAKKKAPCYKLFFREEFNLPDGSQPDSSIWSRAPRAKNMWAKWNSDSKDVVYIKNGRLVCRAIPNTNPADTAKMLTGAVFTKHKFVFKYGKIEVRMRTNMKKGNFPAAWLRPLNDGNPYRYGEMDIIEYFGDEVKARQTIHSHRSVILGKKDVPNAFNTIAKNRDNWHVYAIEWMPSCIKTYVDGKISGCYMKSSDSQKIKEGQWTFDRDFFIILNQSVGYGSWYTPNIKDIYETQFDWVRVYKLYK